MLDTKDPADTLVPDAAEAASSLAHYDLRREIGRGGTSVVYEAQDTQTGQEVALKVLTLPPTLAPDEAGNLIARFEREARAAGRLSHPNVIHIHEIGVFQNRHFLAMEYLRGQTLRERMRAGMLTPGEAFPILTQIAAALDAAHKAGIVHRDVKPANVMLLPDGTVKLLDFGIAQSSEETTITHASIIAGSPSYMAPEQVKGDPATAAIDIWALGVLCYEVLTGYLPFAGLNVGGVLFQIMHQSPAPTPELTTAAQKVLRRALDKQPAKRYRTATALVEALKTSLAEPGPVSAEKPASVAPKPSATFPAVPRWLYVVIPSSLFLIAFGCTVHARHHAVEAGQKPPSGRKFASSSLPPAPATLRPPVRTKILPRQPRALPKAAAVLPKAVVVLPRAVAVLPKPAAVMVSVPHQDFSKVLNTAPSKALNKIHTAVRQSLVVQAVPRTAPPAPLPLALTTPPPVPHRRPDVVLPQSAPPASPAQASVPSLTLPAGDSGDDPEAEARIRKLDWAQGGADAAPQPSGAASR